MDPSPDPAHRSPRPDYGTIQVTRYLQNAAAVLAQLAHDFRMEIPSWPRPDAKDALAHQAVTIEGWAVEAAQAGATGDYATRWDALLRALERIDAALTTLTQWWTWGDELWNEHRARAVPETLAKVVQR